jgi:hypothetical protein
MLLHGLLFLLPAVAVVLPLIARRYPGERLVLALRGARWRPRRSRISRGVRYRGRIVESVRGSRLIGCSLAVRPPPLLLSAS